MEKTRKLINSNVATIVLQSGGATIRHTDINPDPALFQLEEVHLSPLGSYFLAHLS